MGKDRFWRIVARSDDADYDTFLYHYYDLCRQIDGRDLDAAEKTLETLEHLPVEHPYLELEQARYDRCRGNGAKAAERIHRLLKILPEDIRLLRRRDFLGEWRKGAFGPVF